ncbi:hypothetical protein KBX49_02735 [Liquorilactobacillus satsumensis]|uniref:hypothetical protein n=1 Tax=Liquorilactobacillus satsumensis TaxID=259059 RepID=UPI0021C27FEC|nr:hypothetical protein [Liquorilactobacillus satsumensis]MCP9356891.1 hypothetical protein [Liquorilactobacillus satsumensis]MCP9370838.1 hypothetical protein [Liquorilactobacillus satsumensis]
MTVSWQRARNSVMLNLLFILLAVISVFVFFKGGTIYGGGDLTFHINRIEELVNAVKNHNSFLTLFSFTTFNAVGSANQLCYPNLTLLPFVLFRLLLKNPITAYYCGVIFYTYLTFACGYFSLKRFNGKTRQAITFALLYGFSHYRLVDIFTRFDLGEWLALTFLPLVFLGVYEVLFRDYHKWYYLVLGMTLIIYSHILTFVLTAGLIVLLACVSLGWRKKELLPRSGALLGAGATTLLLSAVELYQIIIVYHGNVLYTPNNKAGFWSSALGLHEVFELPWANNIANYMGILSVLIPLLFLLCIRRAKLFYKLCYGLLLLSLIVSSKLFPWFLFKNTPLTVIQFPWRFLLYFTFLNALIGSQLLEAFWEHTKIRRFAKLGYPLCLLLIVILGVTSLRNFKQLESSNQVVANPQNISHGWPAYHIFNADNYKLLLKNNLNFIYVDYWPQESITQARSLAQKEVTRRGTVIGKLTWTSFDNDVVTGSFTSKVSGSGALPVLYYGQQYEISLNGKVVAYTASKQGTLQLKEIHAGQNKISLKIKTNPLVTVFKIISICGWIGLCLFLSLQWLKRSAKSVNAGFINFKE